MDSAKAGVPDRWDLERTERELFFCLNGKRMVNGKNQELKVEQIGHGRSAGEVWIKFKDAKVGRNFNLKGIDPLSLFFKSSGSVTDLIEAVSKQCVWVTVYRRTQKRKSEGTHNETSSTTKMTITSTDSAQLKQLELPAIRFIDNFIGKFEVNVLTLQEPPPEFTTRRLNRVWVQTIKEKIMKDPSLISTVIPVLLDPNQVKDKEDFVPGNISSYNLMTIGGNHLRSALQEIARETSLSRSKLVNIHLYCGLSNSDALEVGNRHNGSQQILKPTFQDCVMQGIQFKNEPDLLDRISRMMSDLEMKEVPKESVGTIVSVIKYREENYSIVKNLFKEHEQKNGSLKSIPQTLFRELQGIKDINRTAFLENAVNNGLSAAVKSVKKAKKISKLEACFMSVVDCSDMDICMKLYPEHVSQIEKFTDLDMPKDTIPEVFLQFCQEAKKEEMTFASFKPDIKISIIHNGRNIENSKFLSNHVNQIMSKLKHFIINHEMQIMKEITGDESEEDSMNVVANDSGVDLSVTQNVSEDSMIDESEMVGSEDRETQPPDSVICDSEMVDSEDRETQSPYSQMDIFQ